MAVEHASIFLNLTRLFRESLLSALFPSGANVVLEEKKNNRIKVIKCILYGCRICYNFPQRTILSNAKRFRHLREVCLVSHLLTSNQYALGLALKEQFDIDYVVGSSPQELVEVPEDIAVADVPEWLSLANQLLGPSLQTAKMRLERRASKDFHLNQIPILALYHLADCVDISGYANERGKHAVALCLVRQCVETLTLIDLGLQTEEVEADAMLARWDDRSKSAGDLRKWLEVRVWPRYGNGLWDEPWAQYFANLAKAVQPYAHYSVDLMNWQLAVVANPTIGSFTVGVGPGTYDPVKASRITLLHALVIWTLGRLIVHNDLAVAARFSEQARVLGASLSSSKLLTGQKDWGWELAAHMFFKPGYSWRNG